MKRKTGTILLFLLWLFFTIEPSCVSAQENIPTPSDDEVNAIAHELYCPVCDNVPLDVCGTQACEQWRTMIRQELAQGKLPEEIKRDFAAQYGEQVLAVPNREGINWLIFILPAVFFFTSIGYAAWVYLPRKTKQLPAIKAQEIDPNTIARMEQTLRAYQSKTDHKS